MIRIFVRAAFAAVFLYGLQTSPSFAGTGCLIPAQTVNTLQARVVQVSAAGNNGGLFGGRRMWSAVVDRDGRVCSLIKTHPEAWPGSRAIALAKAFTANAFSNDLLSLSTTMLYALAHDNGGELQQNHAGVFNGSLFGLNESNLFNPLFLDPTLSPVGRVTGGIITFGGGLALYSGGKIIGGLGLSGDTSCADHAVAFRARKLAGLNSTPNPDNISFPATRNNTVVFPEQPHCTTTNDVIPT
jgi:uncharacterized protein GlcG (DUF336 family)